MATDTTPVGAPASEYDLPAYGPKPTAEEIRLESWTRLGWNLPPDEAAVAAVEHPVLAEFNARQAEILAEENAPVAETAPDSTTTSPTSTTEAAPAAPSTTTGASA